MKSIGTITIFHEVGDPYPDTDTDWEAISNLTEEEIHAAAIADPDSPPLPRPGESWAGLTRIVNVKRLRERLGLTQENFAATYRIPLGTLRDWEQKRKNPDATAKAYLVVIDKDPEGVARMLSPAA